MQEQNFIDENIPLKTRLFRCAEEALRQDGWNVQVIPKSGKGSVRRITRGKESYVVSIRTTQDQWIAFPRDESDTKWGTLSDVDKVVAVSVDDRLNPRFARVHFIDGKEMIERFDRAYTARKEAGHTVQLGRGMWVSLYETDSNNPVTHVGAGAGLSNSAIATFPLGEISTSLGEKDKRPAADTANFETGEAPLTIAEAKRRLALAFGVDPANVKITVEG